MVRDDIKHDLVAHLRQIVRERDPFMATQSYFYVQQYLRSQLTQWGPVIAHPFDYRGTVHTNWSLTLPAQTPSSTLANKAPILIGAHYDTVPGTVGADDNGTGLAVLLELAKMVAQQPVSRPIIFVAFDLEEYGLLGSQAYAQHCLAEKQPIYIMMSLEMLGYCDATPGSQQYPTGLQYFYPNRGDFIALIGNWQSIPTLRRLKQAFKQAEAHCEWLPMVGKGQLLPTTRRSDHASFWDAGYNAILVTDTADLRNPHYHQASDTLDTLDLDFLTGVCLGLFKGLQAL